MDYVSLHNHSAASLLDALSSPKELFQRAKELNQRALAITDHATFAGVWDAYKAAKEAGVKYIVGCEFYFVNDVTNKEEKIRHIVLLAKNAAGYRNILLLNRGGFDHSVSYGKKIYPLIDWEALKTHSEGVICLTSCSSGIVAQLLSQKKFDEARETVKKLIEIYGDNLGLEIQTNNLKRFATAYNDSIEQRFTNHHIIKIGEELGVRIVPTTNSHYIYPEQSETHDVLLAIGAGQSIHSNARLKYDVPQFYVRSGDEVKEFFLRTNSEEQVDRWIANSVYFADSCEEPAWVDPKFSNPSGKELPEFPIQDEPDYEEYLNWRAYQSKEEKEQAHDKSFMRYRCEKVFVSKVPAGKLALYQARLEEEIDVLGFCGVSSYMLIVADYVNWAKNNGVRVGPGRGCLTKDTLVLTDKGYKNLNKIEIGHKVYSHTGKLQNVTNKFEFDVTGEKLLRIKSENGIAALTMTKDHKVLAVKQMYKSFLNPTWIQAKDLKVGDLIYNKSPVRNKNKQIKFDLLKLSMDHDSFDNDFLYYKKYKKDNNLSIRDVSRMSGVSFESVRNLKIKKNIENYLTKKVELYLSTIGLSLNEWIQYENFSIFKVKRELIVDDGFLYLVGRFVGDGCFHGKKHGITISFNKDDVDGISKVKSILSTLGFITSSNPAKNNKGFNLTVSSRLIFNLFKKIIPNYKDSATKHLPSWFRKLDSSNIYFLIRGLADADGSVTKSGENITTVSQRLSLEIKEALSYINIPSSIYVQQERYRYDVKNQTCYVVYFRGVRNYKKSNRNYQSGTEFYSKISSIETTTSNKVYDITVNEDNSYLTTNGVVHNSVGGSLVAYLLGIHAADPIKYGLVFPRFHNKLKQAYSDIDMDFSTAGRGLVKDYIVNKYGKDFVAHVSNINTITPKVYARDIARSCELGGSKESAVKLGNDVAGSISADTKSIEKALEDSPLFAEYALRYPQFEKFKAISGKYRAFSTHAGGIIISKRPLPGLIPLRKDKDGSVAVEYDKDRAEENGLIKMDVLGLSTLDLIEDVEALIKSLGKPLPIIDYEAYDQKTFDLISSGNTFGVFQFGTSGGTIDLCKKIVPKTLEDLALITTLARPASREIRSDFIKARNGEEKPELIHPSLQNALKDTFGFPLYDESLLILSKDVAGWDLNEADKLRKLTKEKGKNPKKAKLWKEEFIAGAINNKITEKKAHKIWEKIVEPFGMYSFNKSHAILYSMLSYHTAFLKAHYPLEFLLANLKSEVKSNSPQASDNIEKTKSEIRKLNIKILAPNINDSDLSYTIRDDSTMMTGLDALKFVGDEAILDIINKRPFKDFFDFMVRCDARLLRSNSIQALASTGCLDSFGISRRLIYLYCSDYRKKLQSWLKRHDPKIETFNYPWPADDDDDDDWKLSEQYALEKKYLGESFICDKREAFGAFFKDNNTDNYKDVKNSANKTYIRSMKVEIKSIFEFKVKKAGSKLLGRDMARATVEDVNGEQFNVTFFPDSYDYVRERMKELRLKYKLEAGTAINFTGFTNLYEDELGVLFDRFINSAAPPSIPKDLKSKAVSIRASRKPKAGKELVEQNKEEILDDLEDELINEGLLDFEDDID